MDRGNGHSTSPKKRVANRLKRIKDRAIKTSTRHPLRVGIGTGVAFIVLGPTLLSAILSPTLDVKDWFNFWTSWIPGACSIMLATSSILITIRIANKQTEQSDFLNTMQTSLTLTANLPALHLSSIEFYSRDEVIEVSSGVDILSLNDKHYRFNIVFPIESLPANYKVEVEKVAWNFPDLTPIRRGNLESDRFTAHIFRNSRRAWVQLDFRCPEQDRAWFDRFYLFPTYREKGNNCMELTLRLRIEDLLLDAVMKNAGLSVKDTPGKIGYNDRLDLYMFLYSTDEYLDRVPRSPKIFVADHRISIPEKSKSII
ncbi:MAG: hypothetical protein HFE92_05785 [Acutalibacter muris]|nr:hypothetical protein [Acutalibacter muris]